MERGFAVCARLRARRGTCRNSESRRRSGAWRGIGVQPRDPHPRDGGGRRRRGRAGRAGPGHLPAGRDRAGLGKSGLVLCAGWQV